MANLNPLRTNLRPWKKGQSGNPGGQPKGTPKFKTNIQLYLRDHPEIFEKVMLHFISDKSPQMRKLLWQMLEGRPKEEAEISGGLNLSVTVVRDDGQEPEPPLNTQTAP